MAPFGPHGPFRPRPGGARRGLRPPDPDPRRRRDLFQRPATELKTREILAVPRKVCPKRATSILSSVILSGQTSYDILVFPLIFSSIAGHCLLLVVCGQA